MVDRWINDAKIGFWVSSCGDNRGINFLFIAHEAPIHYVARLKVDFDVRIAGRVAGAKVLQAIVMGLGPVEGDKIV